jgi:Flp pilus assembly pilin Flp
MKAATLLRTLLNAESGQDLIEYALIAALTAPGAVVSMGGLPNMIPTSSTASEAVYRILPLGHL